MKLNFAIASIFFLVLMGCGENPEAWPRLAFDKVTWAKTVDEKRFVFARDLIDKNRLNGLSKQEVVDALAPLLFLTMVLII